MYGRASRTRTLYDNVAAQEQVGRAGREAATAPLHWFFRSVIALPKVTERVHRHAHRGLSIICHIEPPRFSNVAVVATVHLPHDPRVVTTEASAYHRSTPGDSDRVLLHNMPDAGVKPPTANDLLEFPADAAAAGCVNVPTPTAKATAINGAAANAAMYVL